MVRLQLVEPKDGRPLRALELPAYRPLHLGHAYASTVHSSQGPTSDRALVALDTHSNTTSMILYYVAISRARHGARIYTNSVQELPAAIARRFERTTALNVQRERYLQRKVGPVTQSSTSALGRLDPFGMIDAALSHQRWIADDRKSRPGS